ncbi:precorrin-6A reductase [Halalkalibacter akibai]|uniref:Cobalt-precorrin-6x reductase n=1 Tax=Halalkalibacter akibai (strain ATCC 43226 / DSM 21942 / CIP 109018 / JCM 9157 / 1139) TaxID=1236973 RepID=W4QVH7_HALA3|nr:precorrin-6A reductase [Halalkalibacter akibai]GAE36091.1 cobalt-precorrin-6x reductase [Halalkalibacter akibai JCM 9157]
MILFLAGTSDARQLASMLSDAGQKLLTTVVTDNAAIELRKAGLDVLVGRLTSEDFKQLIQEQGFRAVVDASHPFAEEASLNALTAAKEAGVPYIRYERESQTHEQIGVTMVESYKEAAERAFEKKGVILLTTGSKTLQVFTEKLLNQPDIRVIARMLPRKDNMEKCEQLGFPQKDIIAIQGPFTKEFNHALYRQYGVTTMITKESGKVGSVDEKIEAARELGIETIIIKRPKIQYENQFSSFTDILKCVNELLQKETNTTGGY